MPPIIVVINMMPVRKEHNKRLFAEKLFWLLNSILLPVPLSICTFRIVQRHPRYHQFYYIIWFLHAVYIDRFTFICLYIKTINHYHLLPFKFLVNVAARYIIWPISSLLDQRSSIHASSFQFNNPPCYTKNNVKHYSLHWTKYRFLHY